MQRFSAVVWICSLMLLVHGCSSSTAPGGGGNSQAPLIIPTTVDFGIVGVGEKKDTVIPLINTSSDYIIITGSALSGSEGRDTNFDHPVLIAKGGFLNIHLQCIPAMEHPVSFYDSIRYEAGGKSYVSIISLTATGGTGGTGGSTVPGPGSSFTFDTWQVDTLGVSSRHVDSIYTIVTNSLSFQGKTNVIEVRGPSGDLTYYHVESNGDVSTFVDLSGGGVAPIPLPVSSAWFTIPLGSKRTISNTLFDTTISVQGIPLPIDAKIVSVGSYVGSPSLTVAGKTFPTDEGALTVTASGSVGGFLTLFSQSTAINIWFVKELAFYAKRQDVTTLSQQGQPDQTSSSNYELKSYVKK
jgi:hypothetical protein